MTVLPAFQKTIRSEGSLSGIGLHTGKPCLVRLKPSSPDTGIQFYSNGRKIGVLGDSALLADSESVSRCSSLGIGRDKILTVEHLLSSLCGLEIENLIVEVEGGEIPGLDGSALPFVHMLKRLGVVDQDRPARIYRIEEPIFCYDKSRCIAVYPADLFSVHYTLDYDHPYLRSQVAQCELSPDTFEKEIAPARTFCTEEEAREIPKLGLGLGANKENTLVVKRDGSHVDKQRFPDECARHKILDILGDLALLGFPIAGRVVALRSGHSLNARLVDAILKQRLIRSKM